MGRDLPYFEKNAGDDLEFMLLVALRQRDGQSAGRTKARIQVVAGTMKA
jgi:hypothetical protein